MLAVYLSMLETEEERKSFGEYYAKHYGKCLAVANAITKNHALAEEAVQNAFVRMIEHKEKYFSDSRKKTTTTIVIMVKGESLNLLKREKRFDHSPLEDVEPIIADTSHDMFRIVTSKAAAEIVRRYVSQLDEVNQTIYEKKFVLDMSDGEIAEIVGLNKNAVAVRIHRLRQSLTKILRKEGFVDE